MRARARGLRIQTEAWPCTGELEQRVNGEAEHRREAEEPERSPRGSGPPTAEAGTRSDCEGEREAEGERGRQEGQDAVDRPVGSAVLAPGGRLHDDVVGENVRACPDDPERADKGRQRQSMPQHEPMVDAVRPD